MKTAQGIDPQLTRAKFDLLIEPLRTVAKLYGYAIGVHGSIARDIDLIAVPWTDEAEPAAVLAEALRLEAQRVSGFAIVIEADKPVPTPKPHGRMCWSFHLGGGPYIDLSVVPRRGDYYCCAYRKQFGHEDTYLAFMQAEVFDWVRRCFGEDQANGPELRALRLAEECIEFAQAVGTDKEKLHKLIDYVYSRPAGEPFQELGGVGICLMAAASSVGVDVQKALQTELDRILAKTP